jgi:undecaprenyl-diphosphatase
MSIIEAILLGIIQGLTEFLPISSSGHLELGAFLFQIKDSDNLLFAVAVHFATALSTVIVFRRDIWTILRGLFESKWNTSWKFVSLIVISMVPVGIVGIFFEEDISGLFGGKIILVGTMLLITGFLLLFTFLKKEDQGQPITYTKAAVIGLAQMLAIVPGISRSGATISTALLLNISRQEAARFSFLMVLPPIFGAALLKIKDYFETPMVEQKIALLPLALGFLAAFLSGLLACKLMLSLVQKGKLHYFAIYCFLVGAVAIITGLAQG